VPDDDRDRYPIGQFQRLTAPPDAAARALLIDEIQRAPGRIRALVEGLTDDQLDTPYRDGGWTIRQVVHHVPDSHMNSYIRMKLAVTEPNPPRINAYAEEVWAELPDGKTLPIEVSLNLLAALHGRWVPFLRALTDADFLRAYIHPSLGPYPVYDAVALYAWHGRHHAAHIEQGLRRLGGA
jgi:hypothetical protein